MDLSGFDYPLPKELIAQTPLADRDHSRLLAADRRTKTLTDRRFTDIVDLIPAGDVLVLNDTKVFPARLLGKKKETGGKVDLLFLAEYPDPEGRVRALVQPALKEGQACLFPENVEAVFHGRDAQGIPLFDFPKELDLHAYLARQGTMPLPPYIKREPGREDESTYQTVYARVPGAVAAPTAGLHFTENLLEKLVQKGVEIRRVTLHVGYGTFRPVEDLENHRMHAETFELTEEVAESLNRAKKEKRAVWAVGTTTLRVLETCVVKRRLVAGKGETDLYIRPPFPFEAVDRLITNFHLPKTTLLLLVAAFMGEEFRRQAYAHAVERKYRFYSYGDAMVIL
jgi:S-adenosylmethionine:tRNA ribosyltransferase-isomerase